MNLKWETQQALMALSLLYEISVSTSNPKTQWDIRSTAWEVMILAADLQGCTVDELNDFLRSSGSNPPNNQNLAELLSQRLAIVTGKQLSLFSTPAGQAAIG